MKKERLDKLLTNKGIVASRSQAQRLIMAGEVKVNGELAYKPSQLFPVSSQLEIKKKPPFVSRGGHKLQAALEYFRITSLKNYICADVGASNGGFTDCLLQHGAKRVYAIDVGYGQLHWQLRNDPRVVLMERTNARNIKKLPEPVNFVTVDVSFISVKILLPVIRNWFIKDRGNLIVLIKPQFEAGRRASARGKGVIRDPRLHHEVLMHVLMNAQKEGYEIMGVTPSPLKGPKGNIEFLTYLMYPSNDEICIKKIIDDVIQSSIEKFAVPLIKTN